MSEHHDHGMAGSNVVPLFGSRERQAAIPTPLADAALRISSFGIDQFHAAPAQQGRSITGSSYENKFLQAIGRPYLDLDLSYFAPFVGDFFKPQPGSPLRRAQERAASAFGADDTFFITGGTTAANAIALDAARMLGVTSFVVDLSCHKSIHAELDKVGAHITYAPSHQCSRCRRNFLDVPKFLDALRLTARDHEGAGPIGVVLSCAGYDGVTYNAGKIIEQVLSIHSDCVFIADEAWSAANGFSQRLRPLTCLNGARRLQAAHPDTKLRLLVTQSAHKSISAARQSSFLHLIGDEALIEACRRSLFRNHTTSPSLPHLVSLDLARAQMEQDGEALVDRSIQLVQRASETITTDPELSSYRVVKAPTQRCTAGYVTADRTKFLLDIRRISFSSKAFQELLLAEGLYLPRVSDGIALIHMHIGCDESAVDRLLGALRRLAGAQSEGPVGEISTGYLIPYPPGTPLVVPGQRIDEHILTAIHRLRIAGVQMYWMPSHGRAG